MSCFLCDNPTTQGQHVKESLSHVYRFETHQLLPPSPTRSRLTARSAIVVPHGQWCQVEPRSNIVPSLDRPANLETELTRKTSTRYPN